MRCDGLGLPESLFEIADVVNRLNATCWHTTHSARFPDDVAQITIQSFNKRCSLARQQLATVIPTLLPFETGRFGIFVPAGLPDCRTAVSLVDDNCREQHEPAAGETVRSNYACPLSQISALAANLTVPT